MHLAVILHAVVTDPPRMTPPRSRKMITAAGAGADVAAFEKDIFLSHVTEEWAMRRQRVSASA